MKNEIIKGIGVGLACILLVVGAGSMVGIACSDYEPSDGRTGLQVGYHAEDDEDEGGEEEDHVEEEGEEQGEE